MTIKVNNPTRMTGQDESYACAKSLTTYQWCAVAFSSAVTSGEATITSPAATGRAAGILQNADADTTHRGEVRKLGMSKAIVSEAVAAGAELMIANTAGELKTASGSGSYVVAISREAATAAHTKIAVELVGQYTI